MNQQRIDDRTWEERLAEMGVAALKQRDIRTGEVIDAIETIRTVRLLEKATWGDGAWKTEPDKAHWKDPATGFDCLAVRHLTSGNWCGYVAVTEGHPAYGLEYDAVDALGPRDVDGWTGFLVHGGLTFSDACSEDPLAEDIGICHTPQPGDPDNVWWLGFDAAHAYDVCPAYAARYPDLKSFGEGIFRSEYRTLPYIMGQCADLAYQLATAAQPLLGPDVPKAQKHERLESQRLPSFS